MDDSIGVIVAATATVVQAFLDQELQAVGLRAAALPNEGDYAHTTRKPLESKLSYLGSKPLEQLLTLQTTDRREKSKGAGV